MSRVEWLPLAACRQPGVDPEVFYSRIINDQRTAKTTCFRCPIRTECLEDTMAAECARPRSYTWGVAGGMTAKGRLRLREGRERRWAA